jgi:hypothetical protein
MLIANNPVYTVRWLDVEKTIIACTIHREWDWDMAYDVMTLMNEQCKTVEHGVYSIFEYDHPGYTVPKGSMLHNARRILKIDSPNDERYYFIGLNAFVKRMLAITSKVYGLERTVRRIHVVDTLDDALKDIVAHKASKS